jgi:hypothetical protein
MQQFDEVHTFFSALFALEESYDSAHLVTRRDVNFEEAKIHSGES